MTMSRLMSCALVSLVALTATIVQAATPWPAAYCYYGRWDLRQAGRAVTVNSGSYVRARFSGSSINASFDVALNQLSPDLNHKGPGSLGTIAWQIDDAKWQESEVTKTVKLAEGLASGPHTVWLMVRGLDEHQNRWTPPLVASLTFTGFELPEGGKLEKPLSPWKKPALTMEFLGDSITEGVLVAEGRAGVEAGIPRTWPWLTDARENYAARTAMLLGAEWRQVGFGATGLMRVGSGKAPGALETFDYFYAGCPRDGWQPNVVVVNQGSNEKGVSATEYEPAYLRYLTMIRKAYPKAKIVALRPFAGAQAVSIQAAAQARNAAGDSKVYYIDSTGWYNGPLHPNSADSAGLAEKLATALKTQVLNTKAVH